MRSALATLFLGLFLVVAGTAEAEEPKPDVSLEEQVLQVFSEGANLFYIGRYEEAATTLMTGIELAEKNSFLNRLCYEFLLKMGHAKLEDIRENPTLKPPLDKILRRAHIYERELRTSPDYIKLLIGKLTSGEAERLVATRELVAIGPIAVPHVVEKLIDDRQDELRVYCRVVLTQMGYRAVIPLMECLEAEDKRMVESCVTALTDIGDPRPLPRLQRMIEDPDTDEVVKRVCRNAVAEIARRGQMSVVPESSLLYFQEALRYFRDGDRVRDEAIANEFLFWEWKPDQEPRLTHVRVPRYAWNEVTSEQLIFDGADAYPDYTGYYPLLAAVLEAQWVETARLADLVEDRTTQPAYTDKSAEAIDERIQALRGEAGDAQSTVRPEAEDNVVAFGPQNLYRAVQQSIVSERYAVAARLMFHLRDRWLAQAEALLPSKEEGLMAGKAGTVLIAALDHAEKQVRYHAAITLAHLDPELRFFNAEKVVPILAEAVGEWGMRVVLVVEPDFRERNAARHALMEKGFLVMTAADGFEAKARLRQAPVKDAIIIAADLTPSLRGSHGELLDRPEQTASGLISVLRGEPATEKIPILLSLPENKALAVELQNKLGDQADDVVHKPFDGEELAGKIDMSIGDAELPNANRQDREEVSLEAARALGVIDPIKSQYDLGQAGEPLLGNALHRSDEIREASLRALGLTGRADLINKVTDAYDELEADPNPDVRAAFVFCIGVLDPTTPAAVEIIAKAAQDPSRKVRMAAHEALGHGSTVDPTVLRDFQVQQRRKVLSPGAGDGRLIPTDAPAPSPSAEDEVEE